MWLGFALSLCSREPSLCEEAQASLMEDEISFGKETSQMGPIYARMLITRHVSHTSLDHPAPSHPLANCRDQQSQPRPGEPTNQPSEV